MNTLHFILFGNPAILVVWVITAVACLFYGFFSILGNAQDKLIANVIGLIVSIAAICYTIYNIWPSRKF